MSTNNIQAARERRRDDLVETVLQDLTVVRGLCTDADLVIAVLAIEAVKKLRRPETVARLDSEKLARVRN